MATRRIIDLTVKPKVEEVKEDGKAASPAGSKPNETLNYMVMDTRGKINDALQVLFSRDSKLRRLHDKAPLSDVTSEATAAESVSAPEPG